MHFRHLLLFAGLFLFLGCGQKLATSGDHLGVVEFAVTGKQEAQPMFQRGVLLLHSFEYEDAADAFRKARTLDPDFVMAYWGEAMTYNHPLWSYQDYESGDSILALLASSPDARVEKAVTDLEKDFITGVNILYGTDTKTKRDSAYAEFMGQLYEKYPGNNEVAAFYSVALIGSVPVGRDTKVYEHAAEVAKEVLARNPKHPGALHYLIHAYDDPDHASQALETADAYAIVAPDAGHALHMPSHIYVASGLWDKVVSSNEASWAASVHRKERLHLSNDALSYHAFHWLLYGYLQQGRTADAKKLVDSMQVYCDTLPSRGARRHMIYLKTTYLVETSDYTGDVAEIEVPQNDLNIATRALNHFVHGMNAFQMKDEAGLENVLTQMTAERLQDEEKISDNGARFCGSVNGDTPNALDIEYAAIMELELKAMQAWQRNNIIDAEKFLKEAVDREQSASYSYGPPSIVKPSYELYAEWLMENGRAKEALEQYKYALKVFPNRRLLLQGKENAEKALSIG